MLELPEMKKAYDTHTHTQFLMQGRVISSGYPVTPAQTQIIYLVFIMVVILLTLIPIYTLGPELPRICCSVLCNNTNPNLPVGGRMRWTE